MGHRGTRRNGAVEARSATQAHVMPMTRAVLLAKAAVAAGAAIDEPTALHAIDANAREWSDQGAVDAPYDPEALLRFVEMCPHIGPNLDGICQNVDGYGYKPEPAERWLEDIDSDECRESVRQALEYERYLDAEEVAEDDEDPEVAEATDAEVQEAIDGIATRMRREAFRFDSWFKNCCSDATFTDLRKQVRWDKEATGWGCMEMIRDDRGRLMRLSYVPGFTVRPLVREGDPVEVEEENPATILSQDRTIRVWRRFARYVQIVGSRRVYFKSPGDPRVVSKLTGAFFADLKALQADTGEGPAAMPANELLFFAHHWPSTPCSPPRWISNLLRVLGTREADETNYYHLKNKTFAGGLLFVSGGSLKTGVKERIESRIQAELQGSQNTSRIMVIEAMPSRGITGERSMLPTVSFQSLRDSQTTDGMFKEYDLQAANSIGAAFRQSSLMRGAPPETLNRATADAVLRFSEQQVYEPLRQTFDNVINRVILPELGIKFLRFRSNSPPTRSSEEVGAYVAQVAPHGGITPDQIQRLTSDVLNLPYEQSTEEWTKQPLALTLAGVQPAWGYKADDPSAQQETPQEMTLRVRKLEEQLSHIVTEEFRAAGHDMAVAARVFDLHTEEAP